MFCKNCGTQIPDDSNVCPNCGTVLTQKPVQASQNSYYSSMSDGGKDGNATIALACGISSIVVAILGGILFGVIAGLIAIVLGVVAVISGTNSKKQYNSSKGTGGFICGLLGLIFAVIFTAGCGICGCTDPTGYACYGCVGGSCKAKQDIGDNISDLYDILDDYNW